MSIDYKSIASEIINKAIEKRMIESISLFEELNKNGEISSKKVWKWCEKDFKIFYSKGIFGIRIQDAVDNGVNPLDDDNDDLNDYGFFKGDVCLTLRFCVSQSKPFSIFYNINRRFEEMFYDVCISLSHAVVCKSGFSLQDLGEKFNDIRNIKVCTKGYLYVLYNPSTKLTKIGKTKSIKKRIMQLDSANGVRLIEVYTKECEDMHKVEKEYHERFKNHRKIGEWFDLGDNLSLIKERMQWN